MFDFRRITLFCLEKRLSKHRTTIVSKNLGGHGPFGPPGYAYARICILQNLLIQDVLDFFVLRKYIQTFTKCQS